MEGVNYFTIAFILAAGISITGSTPTTGHLYNALNTGDRIWVYKRSYELHDENNDLHTCVAAQRTYLTTSSYQFIQNYLAGKTRHTEELFATIAQGPRGLPILDVSKKPETHGQVYTLEHWNEEQHCAVLTVELFGKTQCELHVWEQDIKRYTPSTCDTVYASICYEQHTVFSSDCLNPAY
uniref:Putative lipocalin-3 1 n=1 Tax=Amblyomma cajennense TaxID=34607 RepID=A0A023FRS0_AMBCJ